MTKHINNNDDKSPGGRVKSPEPTYKIVVEEKTTSHRKRKIVMPFRMGTVTESAIRKAIKKVMGVQPDLNGN